MTNTYWQKQTADKPLFPDLLWSRPENKHAAGKLLIIGGNAYGFAAPAEAYAEGTKAGIGTTRVVLPLAVKKMTGKLLPSLEYAASTPSGSFGIEALAELLEHAAWADGVLFAGDMGRNSETAILMEHFIVKNKGQVTLTKDAIDYFYAQAKVILGRLQTTLVLTMAQLQKIAKAANLPLAVTFGMDLLQLVNFLHETTQQYPTNIIVKHLDNIFVAHAGQVSTTKLGQGMPIWRVKTAAHAAVWWLQNPTKEFETLTSSVID